jgi:TatD DNase family protein
MFIDTHAHLDMLPETELKKAIKDSKDTGIEKIISCSTSFASNTRNLGLSEKFEPVKAGIGLYPLNALELSTDELEKAFNFFERAIVKAIAVGEVGLDYKYSKKDEEKEKQKEVFKKFILLAKKFDKPLIVHSRYASRDVLELLGLLDAKKVLLHSFVDSRKLMKQVVEKGYFIGVGLSVLENELVQDRVKELNLENILLETDSPIRFSGEKAMPKDIFKIAEKVAELKGLGLEEVEAQLKKNFEKLFG